MIAAMFSSRLPLTPLRLTLAVAAALPLLASAQTDAPSDMARVTVTGSNLRVTQKEGASAVQVLSLIHI